MFKLTFGVKIFACGVLCSAHLFYNANVFHLLGNDTKNLSLGGSDRDELEEGIIGRDLDGGRVCLEFKL
jgi:hypothetical protein